MKGIYAIQNKINKKMYIGMTTDFKDRIEHHLWELRNNKHHSIKLQRAFNKYGEDNFDYYIVEEMKESTFKELAEKERYYIKEYHSHISEHGYNLTWGGERSQYDANPRTSLTVEDVMEIRTAYNEGTIGVSECWKQYSNKISYSAFEKIWEGQTWKGIMMEVYTDNNKKRQNCFKSNRGSSNGNAIYSDEEVLNIRKYYINHSLEETYNMYGDRSANKESFRGLIANSYKHLPIYSKRNKQWSLNGEAIQINNFNPVSTIPVSRE